MRRFNGATGFTLVEVTAALAIGGLVLLLASRFVAPIVEATQRVQEIDQTDGRSARVTRWLTSAFSSLETGGTAGAAFDGLPEQVVFRTRLLGPRGWFESARVQLYLEGDRLTARLDNGRVLVLLPGVQSLHVDYLAEPGEYPKWADTWGGATSAPPALRLRLDRTHGLTGAQRTDTLVFRLRTAG